MLIDGDELQLLLQQLALDAALPGGRKLGVRDPIAAAPAAVQACPCALPARCSSWTCR